MKCENVRNDDSENQNIPSTALEVVLFRSQYRVKQVAAVSFKSFSSPRPSCFYERLRNE